jgi:hypothetical protein
MKMISTMYKCTKDTSQFEEKTYKVPPTTSLRNLNPLFSILYPSPAHPRK